MVLRPSAFSAGLGGYVLLIQSGAHRVLAHCIHDSGASRIAWDVARIVHGLCGMTGHGFGNRSMCGGSPWLPAVKLEAVTGVRTSCSERAASLWLFTVTRGLSSSA